MLWIRIDNGRLDPDVDPGGQKRPSKVEKSEVLDVSFEGRRLFVAWVSFIEARDKETETFEKNLYFFTCKLFSVLIHNNLGSGSGTGSRSESAL